MSRIGGGFARGRVAAVAGIVGVMAGGLTAGVGAETASAASCLGTPTPFTKTAGMGYYMPPVGRSWATTSRCADINLKLNLSSGNTAQVRVCFIKSDGSPSCQSTWKQVGASWKVVASGVRDGTKFRFQFRDSTHRSGFAAF